MKVTFGLNQLELGGPTRFTVFIDGRNAGELVMRDHEYRQYVYHMEQAQAVSNLTFTVRDNRKEKA